MTFVDPRVREHLRSTDGLFLLSVIFATGLGAVACAATGHFVWMLVLLLPCWGAVTWLRSDIRDALRSPEEKRRESARQTQHLQQLNDRAAAAKAKHRETKYGPPPAGAPVVPGAYFVRIREMRWKGLPSGMPMIDLVCGTCGYGSVGRGDWSMPRILVAQFQTQTGPGSGLAAFNNDGATARRNVAIQALTCPGCGSIDPGTWVKD